MRRNRRRPHRIMVMTPDRPTMPDTDAASRLLLGCAGWSLPTAAAAAFPVEGSHLERYAAVFPAVEINSSFYKPHKPATYARWAASVPPAFRFAVKLPRTITHDARLGEVDVLLDRFHGEAGMLGEKLGCLLVQLPPSAQFDEAPAYAFFAQLRARFDCSIACEARHPSWFAPDATALLRDAGVIRVIADPAAGQSGSHEATSYDEVYVRLHGVPRIYYSRYDDDAIVHWHGLIDGHLAAGRRVWCIFDNTAEGAAVPNALSMQAASGAGRVESAATSHLPP